MQNGIEGKHRSTGTRVKVHSPLGVGTYKGIQRTSTRYCMPIGCTRSPCKTAFLSTSPSISNKNIRRNELCY